MPILTITAEEALKNLRTNRSSRWPDGRKTTSGRLGAYAKVDLTPSFAFRAGEPIFTIGSCFAREIERQLAALEFDVPMMNVKIPAEERVSSTANDILNKYVPQAMANELRWAVDGDFLFPDDAYLEVGDGLWHDPHLAANIKPASITRVKERRKHVLEMYQAVRTSRVIIITLGLAEAWFDTQLQLYLNGTPPNAAFGRYPGRFELRVLSHQEIMDSLAEIHRLLAQWGHPDFRILLTVSPVPFKATFTMSDALAANCYSKSVLRAAAEQFVLAHENVNYFPSYETVTLGERSLNYEVDNIHVRREVVARIMTQVVERYMPEFKKLPDTPEADLTEIPTASDPVTLYAHAKGLAAKEDYVSASNVMRNIFESYGNSASGLSPAEFHLLFGIWLLRGRQTLAGERELTQSVALDPTNPRAHYKRALAMARLKRFEEATISFEAALGLEPENVVFHWRLAVHYLRLKNKARAKELLKRALELEPANEQVINALADADALS